MCSLPSLSHPTLRCLESFADYLGSWRSFCIFNEAFIACLHACMSEEPLHRMNAIPMLTRWEHSHLTYGCSGLHSNRLPLHLNTCSSNFPLHLNPSTQSLLTAPVLGGRDTCDLSSSSSHPSPSPNPSLGHMCCMGDLLST